MVYNTTKRQPASADVIAKIMAENKQAIKQADQEKQNKQAKQVQDEVDEYNEEVQRRVVAAAFGPVLEKILREDSESDNENGWPKIWLPLDEDKTPKFTRLRYPKDYKTDCDEHKCGIPADSKFQEPVDLKASLHNFRVYVNDTEYFMNNLPHVYSKWSNDKTFDENILKDIRKTKFDYKTEPYYAMICGACIASYLSGISLLNLFDKSAGNLIASFVRYYFYVEKESVGVDKNGNKYIYQAAIEHSGTDYRSFITFHSDGITPIGQKLFQESLESFNYSVLGAEARTRWSIVGKGAKSSQTQDVFRRIVEDTIIQNDATVLIANMREVFKQPM